MECSQIASPGEERRVRNDSFLQQEECISAMECSQIASPGEERRVRNDSFLK
jgi:hypothetical protein